MRHQSRQPTASSASNGRKRTKERDSWCATSPGSRPPVRWWPRGGGPRPSARISPPSQSRVVRSTRGRFRRSGRRATRNRASYGEMLTAEALHRRELSAGRTNSHHSDCPVLGAPFLGRESDNEWRRGMNHRNVGTNPPPSQSRVARSTQARFRRSQPHTTRDRANSRRTRRQGEPAAGRTVPTRSTVLLWRVFPRSEGQRRPAPRKSTTTPHPHSLEPAIVPIAALRPKDALRDGAVGCGAGWRRRTPDGSRVENVRSRGRAPARKSTPVEKRTLAGPAPGTEVDSGRETYARGAGSGTEVDSGRETYARGAGSRRGSRLRSRNVRSPGRFQARKSTPVEKRTRRPGSGLPVPRPRMSRSVAGPERLGFGRACRPWCRYWDDLESRGSRPDSALPAPHHSKSSQQPARTFETEASTPSEPAAGRTDPTPSQPSLLARLSPLHNGTNEAARQPSPANAGHKPQDSGELGGELRGPLVR